MNAAMWWKLFSEIFIAWKYNEKPSQGVLEKNEGGRGNWFPERCVMSRLEELYYDLTREKSMEEIEVQRDRVELEVRKMLEEWKKTASENEYEERMGKCLEIAELGERGGFIVGFQYAVQIMCECFGTRALDEQKREYFPYG